MNHRGAKTGVFFIVIAVSAASAAAEPPNPHRGFFISASYQSIREALRPERRAE